MKKKFGSIEFVTATIGLLAAIISLIIAVNNRSQIIIISDEVKKTDNKIQLAVRDEIVKQSTSITTGLPTANIIRAIKTGLKGSDGSPQVKVTVKITNLPIGAISLNGFLTTDKDWPFGVAQTEGKSSGDFDFIGYIYSGNINIDNHFSIRIYADQRKELGRIPSSEDEHIPFVPSDFGIN